MNGPGTAVTARASWQRLYVTRRKDIALLKAWQTMKQNPGMPPIARALVDATAAHARPVAALLAWWYLRWTELQDMTLSSIIGGTDVLVITAKHSEPRLLPALPGLDQEMIRTLPLSCPLATITYDMASRAIAHARDQLGIRTRRQIADETHIFRHIEADFLAAHGESLEQIAQRMGHRALSSTEAYLGNIVWPAQARYT